MDFEKSATKYELLEWTNIIREELIMKCMHSSSLERWIEMSGDVDDF